MIYLDNAATSYPKPPKVIKAVADAFFEYGANPGRGGHYMSVKTTEKVYEVRGLLNDFFNGCGAENVCFTLNCTHALNTAINGYVKKGDHIVISCLEHNSVLRPVHRLKEQGIADYSVFDVGKSIDETINNFKKVLRGNTAVCVVTAVSNVFGDVLPLKEIGEIAKANGVVFIVDGAQGAGVVPIDISLSDISCLCVPGHKGLWGPMGTGALIINGASPSPLLVGGTGTNSLSVSQPQGNPEGLESGTLNVPGICGLCEGVRALSKIGLKNINNRDISVCSFIADELSKINNVKVYYPANNKVGNMVSFNIGDFHSESVALKLSQYGVAVRGGYHCSPLAHKFAGTYKSGTVRISPSYFTSEKDINILLKLVRKIAI